MDRLKLILIGIFAILTWWIPSFLGNWDMFVIMVSLLSLFLLMMLSTKLKGADRSIVEIFIFMCAAMVVKCIMGNPYEIDVQSVIGIVLIVVVCAVHFIKYFRTMKKS